MELLSFFSVILPLLFPPSVPLRFGHPLFVTPVSYTHLLVFLCSYNSRRTGGSCNDNHDDEEDQQNDSPEK